MITQPEDCLAISPVSKVTVLLPYSLLQMAETNLALLLNFGGLIVTQMALFYQDTLVPIILMFITKMNLLELLFLTLGLILNYLQ